MTIDPETTNESFIVLPIDLSGLKWDCLREVGAVDAILQRKLYVPVYYS
jgi:hypothetical protein